MKLVKGSFAFAAVALLAGAAQAATVTFTLYQDQNAAGASTPGSFRVTAKVGGGDNGGLSGYGMDFTGTILTMDHQSPRDNTAENATLSGPTGFTLARTADVAASTIAAAIRGSQDIANIDAIMVYGMGTTASSFAAQGITAGGAGSEQLTWGAELLLAAGTYQGAAPTFNALGANLGANVFVNGTGKAVLPVVPTLVVVPGIVPEPATAALGGLSLLGLAAFRRRSA